MWGKMKINIFFAAILVICLSATSCSHQDPPPPDNGIKAMNPLLPPGAHVVRDDENDTIIQLKGADLSAGLESNSHFRRLQAQGRAAELAVAFIEAHAGFFRLTDPSSELSAVSEKTCDLGLTRVRFQQIYQGIPVSNAEINVHIDRNKRVYLVNGRYIPTPTQIDVNPGITSKTAISVAAGHLGIAGDDLPRRAIDLVVFANRETGPRLSFRIETAIRADQGWVYYIDANSGEILERQGTTRFLPAD